VQKTNRGKAVARTKKITKTGGGQGKAKIAQKNAVGATTGKCHSETGEIVTVDRRGGPDRRKAADRRSTSAPVAVERRKIERREKVTRRRQIDPTTCERNYSAEEIEFMAALDSYKRTSGRMFPTCSEILEVLRGLGYEKRPAVSVSPETAVSAPALPACDLPAVPKAAVL
jgi:hypothetical protein